MTPKLALCCAVMILCAMTGRAFAGANTRRAKLLADLMDALQLLKVHVLDRLMPMEMALSSSNSIILSKLGAPAGKNGASAAWQEMKRNELRRGGVMDSLSAKDIQVLDNLFSALGATGKEEQRPVIEAAIRELGLLEAEARQESGDKGRLFTILGALAGTAAVILIL